MPLPHRRSAMMLGALAWSLLACGDSSPPVAPVEASVSQVLDHRDEPAEPFSLGAPLFGLDATRHGGMLAAVASTGVLKIRGGEARSLAELPGVNDVIGLWDGAAYAITGGSDNPDLIFPTSRKLYFVTKERTHLIADLYEFESRENPDKIWHAEGPTYVQSNPFDLERLAFGRVLIADAAANDIVLVKPNGDVDWVAVLTPSSEDGPEPVPTSVAVGPRGDYFVGELTGFPGTPGLSRVWRVERGSRHVVCPGRKCSVVASGFTSIIDMAFDDDGTLYVVEFDEAGWLAVEINGFARTDAGGTVSKCNVRTGACSVVAGGLSLPTAITIDERGTLWVAEHPAMLFAGATVRPLCTTARRAGHALARC